MLAFAKGAKRATADISNGFVEHERRRQADVYERVYRMNGGENAYAIWRELGEWMTAARHRRCGTTRTCSEPTTRSSS